MKKTYAQVRGWARSHSWLYAVLVALAVALVHVPTAPNGIGADMTEYLNQTYSLLGKTPEQARESTIRVFCAQYGDRQLVMLEPDKPYDPAAGIETEQKCLDRLHEEGRKPTAAKYGPAITRVGPNYSERYEAIFLSRPAVAWTFVPGVALLPDRLGIWLTALFFMLLGGFLIFLFLRTIGLSPMVAVFGQLLYYVLPTRQWSMDPRSEAALLTLFAACLLSIGWLMTGRTRRGVALFSFVFVFGFFFKYSQFMLLAAGLAGTGVIALLLAKRAGRPLKPLMIIVIGGAIATAGNFLGAKLMGWPGGAESMQDLLTVHYLNPDVADPVGGWLERNRYFWPWWLLQRVQEPLWLVSWVVAAWGLVKARSTVSFAIYATVIAGLLTQAGHPNPGGLDRLIVVIWFLVICGIPILVQHLIDRREPAAIEGTPATTAGAEPVSAGTGPVSAGTGPVSAGTGPVTGRA
ncbi:hypothetical protein AB0C07_35545 [Actinoplanes missouriensis]|uniref:hypothetical protein n=1 Tax=Actinoplanes missouriensis TaxID=1866 RepID=UPI0033E37F72